MSLMRRIFQECLAATFQFSPCLPVISRRLRICKTYPCEIRTRSGLEFSINSYHDLVTAWIIFCRNEYSPDKKSDVIVDLGANIGMFSLWASQQSPHSSIWAVEPFPECIKHLKENVLRNSLEDRIHVIENAVSRSSGTRLMRSSGPTQSNGLQPLGTVLSGDKIPVDAISLNDLLFDVMKSSGKTTIDFLKIDVEGGEHEFIQPDAFEALRHVEAIGIEYHPNGDREELFSKLTQIGFQLVNDIIASENSGVAHFQRKR